MKTNEHKWYLAHVFLEWEMFHTEVYRENQNILCLLDRASSW